MNPPLTPDDVRAIVREEIGVDCPLSPEVAAEALRAKAVAGLVVQDTRGLGTDGPLDADDARFEPMKRGEDRDDLGLQTGVAVGNGGDELLAERLGLDVVRRKVGDVVPDEPGERRIHNDSSSVVPGVAPSGDDATVEVTGDAARVDSSPRRVAGTDGLSPASIAGALVALAHDIAETDIGDLPGAYLGDIDVNVHGATNLDALAGRLGLEVKSSPSGNTRWVEIRRGSGATYVYGADQAEAVTR